MPGQAILDIDLLHTSAATLGVELSAPQIELFQRYAAELLAWNARLNLTRITSPAGIAVQHFADSLAALAAVDGQALRLADVGSGAGLPGLALKIARPDWQVTLIESVGKKAHFLQHVVAELDLSAVHVLHMRAEEAGRLQDHRERFVLATGRAVADLRVLAEYGLPLLELGGHLVAYKGEEVGPELVAAEKALRELGGRYATSLQYCLPGVNLARRLVVIDKVAATPQRYPRRAGVPERRPLG
jgi:16S rRNA (guanine527-N7)-methyltransferase